MPISDALGAAPTARAFEVREDARPGGAPASALPALPAPSLPSAPSLGIDEGVRKVLRSFRQSYDKGDKTDALKQLEEAAVRGNIAARWKAARMLADGDGVPRDDYRAYQHFAYIGREHGESGSDSLNASVIADSLVAFGIYLRNGIKGSPVRANPPEAMRMFTHAATYYANAEAQYQLGVMYLDGAIGSVDPLRGARWLNLAAEKGHASAQAMLGRMLFMGEAMPRQGWRGLMWLHLARENARGETTGWVRDLHEKAYAAASDEERRMARQHADRFLRASERR
jgi:uncharacterized protein